MMSPRETEKWLHQHGSFVRIEALPLNIGVNLIWNSGGATKIDRGIYFDITGETRTEAMYILYDQVMGYLYDLVLAGGDMTNFPRKIRVNLP